MGHCCETRERVVTEIILILLLPVPARRLTVTLCSVAFMFAPRAPFLRSPPKLLLTVSRQRRPHPPQAVERGLMLSELANEGKEPAVLSLSPGTIQDEREGEFEQAERCWCRQVSPAAPD